MLELLLTLAPIQAPRLPASVVVVSLDNATQGQIRYGRETVSELGSERGSFDFSPSPIAEEAFQPCIDDRLDRAATCARFYIGYQNARDARPPLVVVLLSDADQDNDGKYGQLEVTCVGAGEAASSPEKQTIRIWPDAARMHAPNDLMTDRSAMTDCISSARAESGR